MRSSAARCSSASRPPCGSIWTCWRLLDASDEGIGRARRRGRPVRLSDRAGSSAPSRPGPPPRPPRPPRRPPPARPARRRTGAAGAGRARRSSIRRAIDELRKRAADNPRDAAVRAELGNVYFDAERYADAINWYEASLGLDAEERRRQHRPRRQLLLRQPARPALAQFERSLQIEPKHTKTMLNIGIVRAFGKQDLNGAARSGSRSSTSRRDSAEGQAAKRMIEAVRSAHPDTPAAPRRRGRRRRRPTPQARNGGS